MVNLYSTQQAYSGGSYLSPKFNYSSVGQESTIDPNGAYLASQALHPDTTPWYAKLGGIGVAAPADVVDSVASLFPGVNRGQFDSAFWNGIGLPGMAAWVNQNRDAVEVGSGILGSVIIGSAAEMAASRVLTSGWFAATGLGRAAAPLVNIVGNAKKAAQDTALEAAAAGQAAPWTATYGRVIGAKALQGIAKAGVSEAAIVAAMHNNSAVWTDDAGMNALFIGLGLGIGGAAGAIQGRSMMRRWANSPEVQLAHAQYADPARYERAGTEANFIVTGDKNQTEVLKPTTEFTQFMLNARNADTVTEVEGRPPAPRASENLDRSTRPSIKNAAEDKAHEVLIRTTRKGIPGVKDTEFSSTSSEFKHIIEAAHRDPTILYGADSIGKLDRGVDEILAERQSQIDFLKKSAKRVNLAAAERLETQVPLVLVGSSWLPVNEAKSFARFDPALAVATQQPNTNAFTVKYKGIKYTADESGNIGQRQWLRLTPEQQLAQISAMNKVIDKLVQLKQPFVLPKNPKFHQIDMAIEVASRGGKVDLLSRAEFKDVQEAMLESLAQKAKIAQALPELGTKERFLLNLPQPTSVERVSDPDGTALKHIISQAGKPDVSLTDLEEMRAALLKTLDLGSDVDTTATQKLTGNMFHFNEAHESKGSWLKPVLAFFDDVPAAKWTRFNLAEDIAERRSARLNGVVARSKTAPHAAILTQAIAEQPNLQDALRVSGLDNAQVGGTSGVISATASQFVTKATLFRDTPALKAAQSIRRVVNRVTETHVDNVLRKLGPAINAISSAGQADSKVLLNQYLSHASGWDIVGTVPTADEKVGFLLDSKSESNVARLGRAVKKGEILTNQHTGKPIVLDAVGNHVRIQLELAMRSLLNERNSVRVARGLEPVKFKKFYVPPANTRNKIVGFTIGPDGRAVPGGAIIASTQSEFNSLRAKLVKTLPAGHNFYSMDELQLHSDLWDSAQIDFIDPQHMAAPGYTSTGALTQEMRINPIALEDALAFIKRGYESNANGIVRTFFQSQLLTAEIRDAALTASQSSAKGTRNVWAMYREALMGMPGTFNPVGINQAILAADDYANKIVADHWSTVQNGFVRAAQLRDMVDRVLPQGLQRARSFDALARQLGPHMPYASAVDYAEQIHGVTMPPRVKAIAGSLNRFAASMVLRWLEIPNAAMNMVGIITNMPGLLQSRTVPQLGIVGGVPVIDSARIMARGFRRMLSEHSGADWDMMVRNGDTTQDIAELNKQIGLIKDQGSFARVFFGRPGLPEAPASATPAEKVKNYLARNGIDGAISIIQDTSESLSRRWAHFVGLELADYHGITGMEARHNFARSIANDTIANYDPLNRPEIYSSAFGSMYGLFTSYTQNYYERMFRWMEDGDYKAIGANLTAMAAMFGFAAVPGYNQIAAMIGGEDTGNTLLDGIYRRFGPATGAVVAHGGLSQIVSLLTAGHAPGMALYTRGDMNFRHPGIDAVTRGQLTPIGLQVVGNLTDAAWKLISAQAGGSPITKQYAAEVLARDMPNRLMHGALTVLAAGGVDADVNGNVMAETQGVAEGIYRILGFRSSRQQAEIEAYYLNEKSLAMDAQRLSQLRATTRSAIRGGNYEKLPEIFEGYLKAGGKPWNYPEWIRGIIKTAGKTRAQNELLKSMRSAGHQDLANRIRLFTAPY